jgi:hypothetical protein
MASSPTRVRRRRARGFDAPGGGRGGPRRCAGSGFQDELLLLSSLLLELLPPRLVLLLVVVRVELLVVAVLVLLVLVAVVVALVLVVVKVVVVLLEMPELLPPLSLRGPSSATSAPASADAASAIDWSGCPPSVFTAASAATDASFQPASSPTPAFPVSAVASRTNALGSGTSVMSSAWHAARSHATAAIRKAIDHRFMAPPTLPVCHSL